MDIVFSKKVEIPVNVIAPAMYPNSERVPERLRNNERRKEFSVDLFVDSGQFENGVYILDLRTKGASIYPHWIGDLLPKIKIIEDFLGSEIKTDSYKLLVNGPKSKFKIDTLKILGFKEDNIVFWGLDKEILMEHEKRYLVTNIRPALITPLWVKKWICENFVDEKLSLGEYIYISRSDARRRTVVNEKEVEQHLRNRGFNIIVPSQLSVQEQLSAVCNAKVIVGPHGAGLANIISSPDNITLIELYSMHLSPEYWHTTNILNGTYKCIKCEVDNNYKKLEDPSFKDNKEANLIVDIDLLSKSLEGL